MPPKKVDASLKILLGRPKGSLRMGLVGLPNVGKSTTFNLLSKQAVPSENFPFCTIDPHEARMNVPDDRFTWLVDLYKPKSQVPATLTIFDIAGLVPGAHKGEGLGNAFLSHIQAVDGIYHVLRAFENEEITHTEGDVNPVRDLETIADELRMKDIQRCTDRVDELRRVIARGQDKTKAFELAVLEAVLKLLETDKKWIIQNPIWTAKEVDVINDYTFLTAKPVVYLVNISQSDFLKQKNKWLPKIAKWTSENIPGAVIPFSAEFENNLEEAADKEAFLQSLGVAKSMIAKIIQTGYQAIHLIHFFTSGEDEVRCWTVRDGAKAPQAAGTIHTDMEKGFICAEVTKFTDLKELGNESNVKAGGKLQTKGKEYVVEDGDIMFFKFNPASNTVKK